MTETISVNGEDRPWRGETMLDLLAGFGIGPERGGVAVALNAEVVPRAEWRNIRPEPGDRIEIVHIVRGG